jgi:alkylation response protein AidB-like acyl-CoA dehydrogenase
MSSALRYDEEHALLRAEARRWLEHITPAELRRLAKDHRGDAPETWRELAVLGWTGLVIPEAQGGAGLGAVHLAVLAEESGRQLLPSPLLPTLLAGKLIELAGDAAQRERWLPGVARGETVGALAHVEPDGAWEAGATRATLAGGRVSGAKHHVWAAPTAQLLVAPAREGDALRFCVLRADAPGVAVEPEVGVDPWRGTVRFLFEKDGWE